jgi:hypothetical protein
MPADVKVRRDLAQRAGARLHVVARDHFQPVVAGPEGVAEGPEPPRHIGREPPDLLKAYAPRHKAGQGGHVVAGFDVAVQRTHGLPSRARRSDGRVAHRLPNAGPGPSLRRPRRNHVLNPKEAERGHLQTLLTLAPWLWPEGEPGLRARVVLALLLMVAAKGTNVLVPLVYARAVDALSPQEGAAAIAAVPIALVLGYGLLRICSSGFAELRDAVFVKVQARAARRIALRVFQHLHALSLRFHLDRQTGGLSRVLERGTRGITFTLDFMLFTIVPTIIEILLVAAILWGMFDISFAAATLGTIGVYIAFTLVFTIGACGSGGR